MTGTVGVASAFLNNTPVVAMGVPAVRRWARRHDVAASRLLMPLSFASILGGLCTLIGTSTNLVTDGLLREHGLEGLGFFELAWVGVPCAVVGIGYLVLLAPRFVPERTDVRAEEEKERQRLLELPIRDGSRLAGRTVEESGLAEFAGLFLVRIERGPRTLGPVEPWERVTVGDRLMYAGDPAAGVVAEAEAEPSELRPAGRRARGRARPELHQVVVPEGSRLVGETVERAEFPERYNATVTGVRRGGRRLEEPTRSIVLRAGDTLMLDADPGFREAFEDEPDFYIATEPGGEGRRESAQLEARQRRMWMSTAIMVVVVGLTASGLMHIAMAALAGSLATVAFGLVTPAEARQAVDWSVLLVIGAAFGIAAAMEASGAAQFIGHGIVSIAHNFGPVGILAGVVIATMIMTGFITNTAAAALLFPIALSVAGEQGLDPRPLLIGITIAASLALWTPLGYQTNLMVYGPGNYRFLDFTRVGLPLQLVLAVVAVAVISLVWPF